MNELHNAPNCSVFAPPFSALDVTQQLVARWSDLQPEASNRPDAVRALEREVSELLESSMKRLIAIECDGVTSPALLVECDTLIEATYVLERLEWCVLHNVPYVERPRLAMND